MFVLMKVDPTSVGWGIGGVVAFLVLVAFLKTLIRVCPANAILVVSGFEHRVGDKKYGFRIVPEAGKKGWTVVIPYFERVEALDLTIVPVDVRVEGVNAANGITVGADATACVCIDDERPELLYNAAARLLGKSREEIHEQIQKTMVGNFRGALNRTTPLQAIGMTEEMEAEETETGVPIPDDSDTKGAPPNVRDLLLKDCTEDLSTFGVNVVSVSLQRIWDTSEYIANLANKTLSRKRKEVEIEEARLHAKAEQAESDAQRRTEVAKSQADQKILAAVQELEVFRRQCDAAIEQAKLEADSAIAAAENEGQKRVQDVLVQLQELKNRSEVLLEQDAKRQEAEILAQGKAEATEIMQGTRNELLQRRVQLMSEAGDYGKIALFIQQLPHLFTAFGDHAKNMEVDRLLIMADKGGFDEAVNRGPRALVDFLKHFQEAFGVNIKDLLASDQPAEGKEVVA